jgi:hypothetical protein
MGMYLETLTLEVGIGSSFRKSFYSIDKMKNKYNNTTLFDSVVFWNCSVRQCGILELFRPTVWYFGTVPSSNGTVPKYHTVGRNSSKIQ